jgi:hypothetical protein
MSTFSGNIGREEEDGGGWEGLLPDKKEMVFPRSDIHPFCNVCGWRKGGKDSWDGLRCKCGHSEPVMPTAEIEAIDEQLRGLAKGESQ